MGRAVFKRRKKKEPYCCTCDRAINIFCAGYARGFPEMASNSMMSCKNLKSVVKFLIILIFSTMP